MEAIIVDDSLLHDLKEMVIDVQNLKTNYKVLDERMNILLLENAKLKLILEDICQEATVRNNTTRRKS